MKIHFGPKVGFPAFVSLPSHDAPMLLGLLRGESSEDGLHATISFRASLPLDGFDEEPTFTLIFNPDNLVHTKTSLAHAKRNLSSAEGVSIARHGPAKVTCLSLATKQPVPIICSTGTPTTIISKPGEIGRLLQFKELACATELCILFDYKWIHKDRVSQFKDLFSPAQPRSGLVLVDADRNWLASWAAFGENKDEEISLELPPPYHETVKRDRSASACSTLEYPSQKRLRLPEFVAPGSPTEKATTLASSSPKPPKKPFDNTDLLALVDSAVEAQLPQVVQNLLPGFLARLLDPTLSPSSSMTSTSPPSPHAKIARLRNIVNARVASHAETKLEKIFYDVLDHADERRASADNAFDADIEDHKVDMRLIADDNVRDLQNDCNEILVKTNAKLTRDVGRMTEDTLLDIREEIDQGLLKIKEEAERSYQDMAKRLRLEFLTRGDATRDRTLRATSLP